MAGQLIVLRSSIGGEESHDALPSSLATLSSSIGASAQIIWRRCPTRWLLAPHSPAGVAACENTAEHPRSGSSGANSMEHGLISFLPLQIVRLLGLEGMGLDDAREHRRLLDLNGLIVSMGVTLKCAQDVSHALRLEIAFVITFLTAAACRLLTK